MGSEFFICGALYCNQVGTLITTTATRTAHRLRNRNVQPTRRARGASSRERSYAVIWIFFSVPRVVVGSLSPLILINNWKTKSTLNQGQGTKRANHSANTKNSQNVKRRSLLPGEANKKPPDPPKRNFRVSRILSPLPNTSMYVGV